MLDHAKRHHLTAFIAIAAVLTVVAALGVFTAKLLSGEGEKRSVHIAASRNEFHTLDAAISRSALIASVP